MSVLALLNELGVTDGIATVMGAVGGFGASVAQAAYGFVSSIASAVCSL
jgi:hypothetical protein